MKKLILWITIIFFLSTQQSYALSIRHHLINMGRYSTQIVFAPFYKFFREFPQRIKSIYEYEVWGREKIQKRGRLRYKLFAVWRIIGELGKVVIEGMVSSTEAAGNMCKEAISIFFSD